MAITDALFLSTRASGLANHQRDFAQGFVSGGPAAEVNALTTMFAGKGMYLRQSWMVIGALSLGVAAPRMAHTIFFVQKKKR